MARRRKTRKRLNWGPIYLLLFIVNVFVGIFHSPLTSLTRVRVVGAKDADQARIVRILEGQRGVAALQVNPQQIESNTLMVTQMRSAGFNRNIFGRATLRITYRVPVARLDKPSNVGIDREGAMFSAADLDPKLPVVVPPANAYDMQASLLGTWPIARIAELCEEVPEIFPDESLRLDVETKDGVCLNRASGTKIALGRPDDFPKKIRVLRQVLSERPGILDRLEMLNLTYPDAPAMVEKK